MNPTPLKAISGATFSDCQTYRYHLWRDLPQPLQIGDAKDRLHRHGTCLFIMLNPSTADQVDNDPTVERCQRRAVAWGYARLEVCNLFALRSTDPKALYKHPDPIGPANDEVIIRSAQRADIVICAWGVHGGARGKAVAAYLRHPAGVKLHALKLTKAGEPCHPLYLPYSLNPVPMP